MKLLRYGTQGQEKPGLLDRHGTIRDLTGVLDDIGPEALSQSALDRLRGIDAAGLPPVQGAPRIGPCVARVPQLVCTGLNYADHVKEAKAARPSEPALFLKSISAISGPYDNIVLPKELEKNRLGNRAWYRHRHAGVRRVRAGRASACRGLLHHQRSVRA